MYYDFERLSTAVNNLVTACSEFAVEALAAAVKVIKPLLPALSEYIKANKIQILVMKNSKEYSTAANQYPKLAHLARHAKKKRARIKNIKRLYKLGEDILKERGDHNNNQSTASIPAHQSEHTST